MVGKSSEPGKILGSVVHATVLDKEGVISASRVWVDDWAQSRWWEVLYHAIVHV